MADIAEAAVVTVEAVAVAGTPEVQEAAVVAGTPEVQEVAVVVAGTQAAAAVDTTTSFCYTRENC